MPPASALLGSVSERERAEAYWRDEAASFDAMIARVDRRFLAASRAWVCARAAGDVLEVAIGTGLNLPHYADGVRLTGLDLSPEMLAGARRRAAELGVPVTLVVGDAMALPFPSGRFDAVVCTWSLCGVPDERRTVAEMARVLRPGGALLLADHIVSDNGAVRVLQRLADRFTVPTQGEHWTRRPLTVVRELGLEVVATDRLHVGVVEHLHARVPTAAPQASGDSRHADAAVPDGPDRRLG